MKHLRQQNEPLTINYHSLQGSVATYLRCGGVVNNQIKKVFLFIAESVKNLKIGKYLAKIQARASRVLCTPGQHTAKKRRNLLVKNYCECEFAVL